MPNRYKNILLAALVIFFGFGMSELMKILATQFNLHITVSFFLTLIPGLVIIYFVGKKLRLGEEADNPPEDKE
ncbi:MAG: hypothetical protein RBT34_05080 [Anaerolineaceae bacterium]|jgi:hypothetical protein|nr:hypothetical protein [Anaerolineaceae bacterium]